MNVGSLFSGIGLLDYGLHLAGFDHSWFCEADEFRRGILAQRWPGARIYDDVRSLRGDAVEPVDLVVGGFPCKGASNAGKREGFGHPETVLWREQARILGELRPRYALVENVAAILGLHRGEVWGTVLGDLAALGYEWWYDCFPAAAFGAPHGRDRVFLVAHADESDGRRRAATGRVSAAARTGVEAPADTSASGRRAAERELHAGEPDATGCAVADAAQQRPERGWRPWPGRDGSADGNADAPNPVRPRLEGRGLRGAASNGDGEAAPDPGEQRRLGGEPARSDADAERSGVQVEWGPYRAAVERWEAILGRPSPQPLVRRVDDGRTRRVERSRLSALGDGVLVQAGWLLGTMIRDHSLIAASPSSPGQESESAA